MKIKTSSDIKRFQEDKELGSWFGKLLPIISAMDNCVNPNRLLNQEEKLLKLMAKKLILKKAMMMIFPKKRHFQALPQGPLIRHQKEKGNMYLHQPVKKKSRGQTERLLTEMKDTMNTLKALASDTSSKELLDFLKEKCQRHAARDDAFLKIMGPLVQQPHPVVTSPIIPPMSKPRIQFRYGMTNFRPNSSMAFYQGNMPQDFSGFQQEMSFIQQMNNLNFP